MTLSAKGKSAVRANMEYDFLLMREDRATILANIDVVSPRRANCLVKRLIAPCSMSLLAMTNRDIMSLSLISASSNSRNPDKSPMSN